MSVSRRGLFGLMAVAPIAAVKVVQAAAEPERVFVDPPMIAIEDMFQGGTNLYAGAINWVDPDYDERTGEIVRRRIETLMRNTGQRFVLERLFLRMNIVNARPPNYAEIAAAFNLARWPTAIFCYGDTIYNPSCSQITPALMAH